MQLQELKGKVVLITGAGSGLGEATAHAFAQEGCAIACIDLNTAAVEQVSTRLNSQDQRSIALTCDISDAEAVFEVVEQTVAQLGRLDIIVNCAAVDYTLSIEELSVEQWDREINVNLRGPFLVAKAAWPVLKQQRSGHIFNIASTAALSSWANAAAYHASKRGLIGLSQGLNMEGRPYNIHVSTIIPGGMRTHFFDRFTAQGIPMPDPKDLQEPENVAAAIVFSAKIPAESAIQEMLITPFTETSWP